MVGTVNCPHQSTHLSYKRWIILFSSKRTKPVCIYASLGERHYRGVEVEGIADYNFSKA